MQRRSCGFLETSTLFRVISTDKQTLTPIDRQTDRTEFKLRLHFLLLLLLLLPVIAATLIERHITVLISHTRTLTHSQSTVFPSLVFDFWPKKYTACVCLCVSTARDIVLVLSDPVSDVKF